MERDGLQKSLKVLQEEYQSVAKEAKVFCCMVVHNFYSSVTPCELCISYFQRQSLSLGNWRLEIHSELQKASVMEFCT